MQRRTFLRLMAAGGTAMAHASWLAGVARAARVDVDARESLYGRWTVRDGLPAFVYDLDQEGEPLAEWNPFLSPPTRRNWLMVGNRAIRLQAANDGTVALFDEGDGLRWLVAPEPAGTGLSIIEDDDGIPWGTDYATRGGEHPPRRTFGPTWFEVEDVRRGLVVTRTVCCPEGAVPWVLVRVRLALARAASGPRTLRHVEQWQLRPRFLNLLEAPALRQSRAEAGVTYEVISTSRGLAASERFAAATDPGAAGAAAPYLIGPPATLVLERLGATRGDASERTDGAPHPVLEIATPLRLRPGEHRDLWFRFGRQDDTAVAQPSRLFTRTRRALAARLPRAMAPRAPEASQEIPWHTALLTGGLAVDRVLGDHSLDQASTYSYLMGFNGAARDPLQHALPLVYVEPDLALSVLRNTCAWAEPNGDLPYALDGAKRPTNLIFRPSDGNLWALWLGAEYAAATGDLAAFDEPLAYHPSRATPPVALREHLRRQFRFFVDEVGRGERDHVRILNADWNDTAVTDSGVDPAIMTTQGSSVLNSAMASWVLGVFAGLATRLGETALAAEATAQSADLRRLVAQAWNGRWFHRAYAPGVAPVGEADCWLEVQPWAILCGAADDTQAAALLALIDQGHRAGSPLGARLRWPSPPDRVAAGTWGDASLGGVWYAIVMTLVWAAARVAPDLAWDEWRRMTLGAHTRAYPTIWEGTLSGPDAWNAPESTRPGRTWSAAPAFAMQAFPVNNSHSHAQPLLAYLRLLGVEPTNRGTLAVGRGAEFRSRVFELATSGRGSVRPRGAVVVESSRGTVHGGPGRVRW
jgi:hypothetical protein